MMINLSTQSILLVTAIVIGIELLFFAILLIKKKLFAWTKSGFWTWVAFLIYFVITPVSVILTGNVYAYQERLTIAGGAGRGLWILFIVFIGILTFFFVYIRTKEKTISWRLSQKVYPLTVSSFLILLLFFAFGLYSILTFRTGLFGNVTGIEISNGRFIGNITGYQYIGYTFLIVPFILLLFSPGRLERCMGWVLSIGFVILSIPDAWSRFITVSFILALSIIQVIKSNKSWPSPIFALILLSSVILFQIRGHSEWEITDIDNQVSSLIGEFPYQIMSVFAENDTAMLATFYIKSYLHDTYIGYDYGIPLVNYILFGFVPTIIFPQKYFLIDNLRLWQGTSYPLVIDQYLFGAKSSLLGDFYANGGIVGVLIGAAIAGFLSRRLDGMLHKDAPTLVKTVGAVWLSMLWIVWGSGSFWAFSAYGSVATPALALWLIDRVSSYGGKRVKLIELHPSS